MPASQLDEKQTAHPESWVGQTVKVAVLEMDRAKSNVLVSRRRLIEQEKSVKRAATLNHLQVGQVIKGRVTGLTNFGAFVDIGGIEGLLHVSDLAWQRVDNPNKLLKVGDEIEVKVLKHDAASNRISLGRKQLLAHPWEGVETKFPVGSTVKGKVTGLAEFGAFVELAPAIEGLIHISEFSWTEKVKKPGAVLKVGQEVEAKLIAIDREKEKISLSLKRMGPSPWEEASRLHPIGSKVEGEVTHLANFGAFVKIAPGVEALLKTQDMSWTDRVQNPGSVVKVGDKITAIVLEVNPQQEKMALGLKQLTADPFKTLKIGQEVTGAVSKVADFGLFVKLTNGLDGLVRSSEMQVERSMFEDRNDRSAKPSPTASYKEGDAITASVLKINKKDRKIELSIRKYEKNQEKELLKKYSGKNDKLTLGETTGWGVEPKE
jgi:small subunit ribosomal protein S1